MKKSKEIKIAIIGGGASGIFSSLRCAEVAKENNIKRVQTAVRVDFDKGLRFAKWLGLENEGLMKHYGFDDSHQYRYARIF